MAKRYHRQPREVKAPRAGGYLIRRREPGGIVVEGRHRGRTVPAETTYLTTMHRGSRLTFWSDRAPEAWPFPTRAAAAAQIRRMIEPRWFLDELAVVPAKGRAPPPVPGGRCHAARAR